jgi:hypothetical protein
VAEVVDKNVDYKGPRYLHPRMRIALCGYEGDYDLPDDWECVAWKSRGGYGSQNNNGNENPHRERIWFSPHCLRENDVSELPLFADVRIGTTEET